MEYLTCHYCNAQYQPQRRPRRGTLRTFCSRECKNRESVASGKNLEYQRESRLKRRYGITTAEYDAMREAQGSACALCGRTEPVGRISEWTEDYWLHVDHDHETGAIRALLCSECNNGMGKLGDDPDLLRKAAEYVESYRP